MRQLARTAHAVACQAVTLAVACQACQTVALAVARQAGQ